MSTDINYFQHLMDIKSSEYTHGATLVLNLKYGHANIKFANDEYKEEFDKSLPEVTEKIDFMKLMRLVSILAMDVDGDTVVLDLFITMRDSFDLDY